MKLKLNHYFLKFSPRSHWKEILAVFVILLAFVFFRSERHEMRQIIPQLKQADSFWIIIGVLTTFLYIFLQALMYFESFKAVGLKIKISEAITLYLKRNFLSVFLPAGGVTSLAYLPTELKRKNYDTGKIHQTGVIYGFVGLFTLFLVGIPVLAYSAFTHKNIGNSWIAIVILGAVLLLFFVLFKDIKNEGSVYKFLDKKFPTVISYLDSIFSAELQKKYFYRVVFYSVIMEFVGIFHVFIAMAALGASPSFSAAAIGYTVSVLLMIISPFLRGLGAVEVTMLYIFNSFGFNNSTSLGITLLYRIFEFWLPLFFGIFAFLYNGRKLFARIFPAIVIFFLGIINLISVITPPLADRITIIKNYLPFETRHISKLAVLVLGIGLLIISAQLLKGLKSAWFLALIFSLFSIIGNVFKAFDYEEASFALITILLLIFTRKQYLIKTNFKYLRLGLGTIILVLSTILVFDFFSFYLIDVTHFGIDFTWSQSIYYTFQSFLLFYTDLPKPATAFGRDFISITKFLGFISWILLIFALLIPFKFNFKNEENEKNSARELLEKYGNSALDFFKISKDKSIYFSESREGFVSFKIANNFAVVLEQPVCDEEDQFFIIKEFEEFCRNKGLKPIYYRAPENNLFLFKTLKKQKLLIGQEALVDVQNFTLQGKDRKSLRNGINSIQKKGYNSEVFLPPHSLELMSELKSISDEWLTEFDKKESVFSQGSFEENELETQPIIAIKDENGNLQAFLNIIPDFAPEESTYDLIRKRKDAPGGCLDVLIVRLIEYSKEKNLKYLNMGLTPMSGIDEPDNPVEQIMKYAYHRVGSLKHFQTLRFFKEKYATVWENKYLVYNNDFELLQIPTALNKVMKE
ncbi:flippase-like domain-containing protein [Halpernia frigidisoli]|uniref:Phosphatidylglycerol lysyltransferase n=1 Tax=Halpernia frigidisoli TaxID=1125876 RepID=A0A1I3HXL1_9FLAO|nr:flippase-like domain-containing protein [Halpernia frigidisoli]SFI40307.1 phosphatidylglycerol lysyltransferase [Halpernia frigidisoli]